MTNIEMERAEGKLHLTALGHADAGKPDLVCASVSTLCCTLLENVLQMEEKGELSRLSWGSGSGDFYLEASACPYSRSKLSMFAQAFATGFSMLAHDYPNNVKFSLVSGREKSQKAVQ